MNEHVLEALRAECERTGELLETLTAADWARPTRCPPLSVFELAVHAWRGSQRILEMTTAGPRPEEAEKSAVTYFQYDVQAEGPVIVQRAQEAAGAFDSATFATTWKESWAAAVSAAAPHLRTDEVFDTIFGRMHLSEYLKTRVVEVTIHSMDLREGMNLAPDPTAEGLTVCCDVLRGLLGADARPLGIDDVRFAETATGRALLDEAEREMLGPLADLFPVLA